MCECRSEKQRLQSHLVSCESTLRQLNWNLERIAKTIARKEGIIAVIKQTHSDVTLSTSTNSTAATTEFNIVPEEPLFSKFSERFTATELAELRTISESNDSKANDSTLVLKILRFLYKNDMEKIATITVSGSSRTGDKERISQQHFDTINDMLVERFNSIKLLPSEYAMRIRLVGTHIKNGIFNMRKTDYKLKKSQPFTDEGDTLQEINEQSNLSN